MGDVTNTKSGNRYTATITIRNQEGIVSSETVIDLTRYDEELLNVEEAMCDPSGEKFVRMTLTGWRDKVERKNMSDPLIFGASARKKK
jgi:hypothetical protein